ncbi:MAG: cobyrinate a,c-diamide synthase [Alphaproteobacteria bacterium]
MTRGLIIAAPASGSGKTLVTLALLRCLRERGLAVASIKVGPDYIDPAFHAAASGRACLNLDAWAMRPETLAALAARAAAKAELVIGEGVMGLFDGASDGSGSTAEVALTTGWPVVLVVDAKGMAASAAALVHGFTDYRPELPVAGVIFNRVGSARHAALLTEACAPLSLPVVGGLPVLGTLPQASELELPDRHLGLVQAAEHPELEAFLARAAEFANRHLDIEALIASARPCRLAPEAFTSVLPPLGQRIAVARDVAFAFAYPFVLDGWRVAGAEITTFSPLDDEAPDPAADAVYLPGGYPELHAGRLAANAHFLEGLRAAASRGAVIYGECGGYMTLGRGLFDAQGQRHALAGLLPVETSFAEPGLHLGYREVELLAAGPLGPVATRFRGHEFHFAQMVAGEGEAPLFRCRDARGIEIGTMGSRVGTVIGSFLHLVDGAAAPV